MVAEAECRQITLKVMRWRLVGRRPAVGLSCRQLDGAVRQQCAGHLSFERQATVNGGFPIPPTGSTDPVLPFIQPNDQ